jgi:hypothetical protein
MNAYPKSFHLDTTLSSLRQKLTDQRSMAQASARAVAIKVGDATLACVVERLSAGFVSGAGP